MTPGVDKLPFNPVPKPPPSQPKERKPLQRKTQLQTRTTLQQRTPLKPRSDHPAAKRREQALEAGKRLSGEFWDGRCIVSGAPVDDFHHAYKRRHRSLYGDWRNLWPLSREVHELAERYPRGWVNRGLREATDYLLSQAPEVPRSLTPQQKAVLVAEVRAILRMHREREAARRHVSPMGGSD